jgi:hypothetical protein
MARFCNPPRATQPDYFCILTEHHQRSRALPVEVALGEIERLADPQPCTPQQHDQRA